MAAQWYTLSYQTVSRGRVVLYNLQAGGAADIERAQTDLGSHGFNLVPQTHHYDEFEVQAARAGEAR